MESWVSTKISAKGSCQVYQGNIKAKKINVWVKQKLSCLGFRNLTSSTCLPITLCNKPNLHLLSLLTQPTNSITKPFMSLERSCLKATIFIETLTFSGSIHASYVALDTEMLPLVRAKTYLDIWPGTEDPYQCTISVTHCLTNPLAKGKVQRTLLPSRLKLNSLQWEYSVLPMYHLILNTRLPL